jgi:hypothetical protein
MNFSGVTPCPSGKIIDHGDTAVVMETVGERRLSESKLGDVLYERLEFGDRRWA